jgi:neuropeptide Y receptor
MINPTNLFITNLACADILMCCFSVPFTPIQSFTGKWHFGKILCTLFPVSQGTSIYVSTMTMTIIAVDRFVVVCYPYRQRMQVISVNQYIIIQWAPIMESRIIVPLG